MREKFEEWINDDIYGIDYEMMTDTEKNNLWKLIECVCEKISRDAFRINENIKIKDSKYYHIIVHIFNLCGTYGIPSEVSDEIVNKFYKSIDNLKAFRI